MLNTTTNPFNSKTHFSKIQLDDSHVIYKAQLPDQLKMLSDDAFSALWATRPKQFHKIKMMGKTIDTPRWQQAFAKDYRYSGNINHGIPLVEPITSLLNWCNTLCESTNGVLVNYYDGALGHYIGPHRDTTQQLIPNSLIFMISFGETRTLRLIKYPDKSVKRDVTVEHNDVVIMPWNTNSHFTHQITKSKKAKEKRISVTLRSFID